VQLLLVYDVSSRLSFEALSRWWAEYERYAPSGKALPRTAVVVAGNKVRKGGLEKTTTLDLRSVSIAPGPLVCRPPRTAPR
jgi:hypothetical protein